MLKNDLLMKKLKFEKISSLMEFVLSREQIKFIKGGDDDGNDPPVVTIRKDSTRR